MAGMPPSRTSFGTTSLAKSEIASMAGLLNSNMGTPKRKERQNQSGNSVYRCSEPRMRSCMTMRARRRLDEHHFDAQGFL
jgi:hypothetical protein